MNDVISQATKPGWQSTEAILTGVLAWVCREITTREPASTAHAVVLVAAIVCLTASVIAYSNHRSCVKRASLFAAIKGTQQPKE